MWVTLLFLVLFIFFGFLLMFLPGILAKVTAIPMFLFLLPILAGKWIIVNDSTGAQFTFIPPATYTQGFAFFAVLMLYISTMNVMDYLEREVWPWNKIEKRLRKVKK